MVVYWDIQQKTQGWWEHSTKVNVSGIVAYRQSLGPNDGGTFVDLGEG